MSGGGGSGASHSCPPFMAIPPRQGQRRSQPPKSRPPKIPHCQDPREAAMTSFMPAHAMVFAAGLGTRMRPITSRLPKPLVSVAGKPLIDHTLDRLAQAGVEAAAVNVHWLADQIEAHLATRKTPRILISDERDELLGQGGGIAKHCPCWGSSRFSLPTPTLSGSRGRPITCTGSRRHGMPKKWIFFCSWPRFRQALGSAPRATSIWPPTGG